MRSIRNVLAAFLLAGITTLAPVTVMAPAHAAPTISAHHKCTRTSTGKCIRGGEFCPKVKYHKSGWNAQGKRYVCKGSHSHPHWELP
jgi:hypothetical protein